MIEVMVKTSSQLDKFIELYTKAREDSTKVLIVNIEFKDGDWQLATYENPLLINQSSLEKKSVRLDVYLNKTVTLDGIYHEKQLKLSFE